MNPILELAEWHERKAEESTNNAKDVGPCEDETELHYLKRLLRDSYLADAARHRATAAALRECAAHRDYPSDVENGTAAPENENVNIIRMARLGTCMDDTDRLLQEIKS